VTLATILRQLARVPGIRWIRLLYGHPASVDDSLLQVMAAEERICRYLDLPLQHISTGVLRRMRRGIGGRAMRALVARIRAAVPGIALRTSLIVGFPGETERDFSALLAFVREAQFERAGVFEYSPEDGTAAEKLPGRLPQATVKGRYHRLMKAQAEVARAVNRSSVGTTQEVLVCGEDEAGRLYGRLPTQAPEVDGVVYLRGLAAAGEIVPVRVVEAGTYDLQGQVATPVDTLAERL